MSFQNMSAHAAIASQRTEQGLFYERLVGEYRKRRRSVDPAHRDKMRRLDESVGEIRGVSAGAVHQNGFLSNLSVQYANDEYIGEQLMPAVPVSKRSDSYATYDKRDRLAYPDDDLSERARANELGENRGKENYSVRDYGYSNFVSAETLENEDAPFDEMFDLVEAINEGVAFRREKRIASILTNASNFSGNTLGLSGSSKWSDTSGGDPIKNLQDARAALWQGRGATKIVAYSSLDVFNTLARHDALRDLFKFTKDGLATRQQIAQYFGFDDYLVGSAREDTANRGQTASYGRIWGNVFGVVRVAQRPSLRIASFGVTFRLKGDPKTSEWYDPSVGKGGGYYARVAVSEDHKVIAGDTGYLITGAI